MEQHRTPDLPPGQHDASAGEGPSRKHYRRWLSLPLIAAAGLTVAVTVLPPDPAGSLPAVPSQGETLSSVATAPSSTQSPPGTAPGVPESPAAPSPASTSASTPVLPSAAPGPSAAPEPSASRPIGLTFPAAGIDIRILPLTPSPADLASQSLVPPLTLDAYWLTSYGVPGAGSSNTTYIAGHSWDGRDAPFNRLSDEALLGAEFTLTTQSGGIDYVVDSVTTHDKETLKDSDIWLIAPNRVVLISCYTEDPWGKNVVVTAMPVDP